MAGGVEGEGDRKEVEERGKKEEEGGVVGGRVVVKGWKGEEREGRGDRGRRGRRGMHKRWRRDKGRERNREEETKERGHDSRKGL